MPVNALLVLSFAAGAALVASAWFGRKGETDLSPHDGGTLFANLLWAVGALKLALLLHLVASGYVTQWGDDACRVAMTADLHRNFRLGPGDHIWPGGPFMLGVLATEIIGDLVQATRWLAYGFSLLSVLAVGWLVREATRSAAAAIAVAFVLAALPMHTWLGNGAMTEVPTGTFFSLSLLFALAGWRWLVGGRWTGGLLLLAAGFCATAASSYRYEGWMFCVGFGMAAWGHLAWRWFFRERLGPLPKGYVYWLLGASLLTALFPVAWMIDSWRMHGHPLAFFRNQTAALVDASGTPFIERLMALPREADRQIRPLWGLVLAGVICAILQARQRPQQLFVLLVALFYWGILLVTVATKGMGMSPARYVISMIVALLPVAGFGMAAALPADFRPRGPVKPVGWIAAGLTAALLLLTVVRYVDEHPSYKWWGFQNESFAAGSLLQQEFHEPQLLPAVARGGRVVIWQAQPGHGLDTLWHIPVMAGNFPERFVFHVGAELTPQLREEPNLTVLRFSGKDAPVPADMKGVVEMGALTVFTRE